jgi:hypothetical protein
VDNTGTTFFIFSLGNPHVGEGAQTGKDGTTDPDGESSFRGGNDFDLHGGGGQELDFFGQSFGDTLVHSGSSGHNYIGIEVFSNIYISFHDGFVGQFVHTIVFFTN